ncbi:MAG: PEGA domain-containing protein [Sandaracinaceae bacterium]
MTSERTVVMVLTAAVAVASAGGVQAQDAPADPPSDDVAQPEPDPQFEEARARFLQGIGLAEAGNCPGAIAEFDASLALVPRANTLFNIARCQETLHRYDLAVEAFERYLDIASPDDADRATVEATMRQLQNLLGTLHVASTVEAEVWLQDRVVGVAPGDVLVPGGRHVLELRAPGRLPERREVEVTARGETSVAFELRAAETNVTTNVRTVSYEAPPLLAALTGTMIGVALGTAAVGAGFGIDAIVQADQVRAMDGMLPRDLASISDAALYADILYVAGGLLGATALLMALLTDWGGGSGQEDQASTSTRVMPVVGPLFVGLRLEGRQ